MKKKLLMISCFTVFVINLQAHVPDTLRQKNDSTKIFDEVDEIAGVAGGMSKFYKLMSPHLRYPAEARRKGIEGKVQLEFVVNADGTLSDIKVLEGIGGGCDEEAIRVLKATEVKWIPGMKSGVYVRSRSKITINFRLN